MTAEVIKLPTVTVKHKNGKILIISNLYKMQAEFNASKMENWAMGLLRKELTVPRIKP